MVVDGDGQFAAEGALHLAESGHSVTITHCGAELAAEVGAHTRRPLLQRLAERGARVIDDVTAMRIEADSCVVTSATGQLTRVSCKTLISAWFTGALLDPAWERGRWRLERIGDCVAPRRIIDAVHEANMVVRRFSETVGRSG